MGSGGEPPISADWERFFVVLFRADALSVVQRRSDGQKREQENGSETERGLYEASDAKSCARRGRRLQADPADRGHQKALGLHQEERASGREKPADDQR